MKLCRDELLLLGGIYQVAALIVSLFTSDIAYAVNGVLYILFWIAVLAIAFNWVPGFVFQLNELFLTLFQHIVLGIFPLHFLQITLLHLLNQRLRLQHHLLQLLLDVDLLSLILTFVLL